MNTQQTGADGQKAYATNIKRLVAAKRKYDPEAIFRFAQGITASAKAAAFSEPSPVARS